MQDLVWLAIALPLAGSVTLHFLGRRLRGKQAGWLATLLMVAALAVSASAAAGFFTGTQAPVRVELFSWIPALGLDVALRWDPLSAVMTLLITGVGTLIHLYSIAYMAEDQRFSRFFAYLNLFAASMLVLVLADNFGLLFVGWELVGLCSYLLISFWFTRPIAAAAGKKAFLVNRIGDLGFTVALMLIFANFGSLEYSEVLEDPSRIIGGGTATAIGLLLAVGAAGKSAQLPLATWLPDAMEGPTPVSALIHAATMVTAGVYMVARAGSIFQLGSAAAAVVATVGVITALWAATIALVQRDIKRVLAYSTISQLGYMFLAVGVGAHVAGVFHLLTHGFFKALLFLAAGSVIHALANEQDIGRMGGLRRALPLTFAVSAVGWLAISGVPPLSGFWSKDEILAAAFAGGGWNRVLWGAALFTAFLTALYATRWFLLVFLGDRRGEAHPHESPPVMGVALLSLAGLAVVGGLINTPFRPALEHFLEPSFEGVQLAASPGGATPWVLAAVSVVAALGGIAVGVLRYRGGAFERAPVFSGLGGWWRWVSNGYYLDSIYGNLLVLPGKLAAAWVAFVADKSIIDGAVNGVGWLVRRLGSSLRPLQTGFVRTYGAGLAAGTVGLLVYLLSRGTG